jgi:hypothetical protein
VELRVTNLSMTFLKIGLCPVIKLFADPDTINRLLFPICEVAHESTCVHYFIKQILIAIKEVPRHILVNTLLDSVFGLHIHRYFCDSARASKCVEIILDVRCDNLLNLPGWIKNLHI